MSTTITVEHHRTKYREFALMLAGTVIVTIIMVFVTNITIQADTEKVMLQHACDEVSSLSPLVTQFKCGFTTHYLHYHTVGSKIIHVERGTSVTVPIVIDDVSNQPRTSVYLTNFHDPDEMYSVHLYKIGNTTYGGPIPVSSWLSFSPTSVVVHANSSATVNVIVSIPYNFPPLMFHNELPIGTYFDINPSIATIHERGDGIYIVVEP